MNRAVRLLLPAFVASVSAVAGVGTVFSDSKNAAPRIEVTDARFRVVKADGGVLGGAELVGLVMHLRNDRGEPIELRIDSVATPEDRPDAGIELYGVSRRARDGAWVPLCKAGADGRALGFPLPGAAPADDETPASGSAFSITCTAGARGKCVMLGYRPWALADDGQSLQPYFAACVRMMRADYCGDGRSFTRPGVSIDMWDRAGVQAPQTNLPFEAAWSPEGAVCVSRPRVTALATRDEIQSSCPRLAAHSDDCESWSRSPDHGALLWNRSPSGD